MTSIITPVYNTLQYLPATVESVLCQSCPDWELILVDDGSTDGSAELCDNYAASDPRIHVIHQENSGLSAARNTGLSVAIGDYLQFLDSDDWISPDTLETLLQTISGFDAEMVIFDAQYEFYDHSFHERSSLKPGTYTSEVVLERLSMPSIPPYAWNKFCLRSLYDDILFPVGEKWEDVSTVIYPVSRAKRIAVIDRPLYHYRQREDAITKQAIRDNSIYKWRFLQYAKRFEFLKINYSDIAKVARSSLIRSGLLYYSLYLRGKNCQAERQRILVFMRLPEMGQGLPSTQIRLARIAFCSCPHLTALILRLWSRFRTRWLVKGK